MSIQDIAQAIERAIQLLEELEQVIDSGDNRAIGARLYELRRELKTIQTLIHERK